VSGKNYWVWRSGHLVLALVVSACIREPRPLPVAPEGPGANTPTTATAATATAEQDWSYEGVNGPGHWATLRSDWSTCANGTAGSPVDLPLDRLAAGPAAKASVVSSHLGALALRARSDGRIVELLGDDRQRLEFAERSVHLAKIEFHTPTEHRLGGISAALELTLWFDDPEGGVPVALSILFRSGRENPTLQPLLDALPPKGAYDTQALGKELDLPAILPAQGILFSYEGSATTPPCQTPVTRLVLAQMGELSDAQLETLRKALGPSNRPTQPLGDRVPVLLPLRGVGAPP